MAQTVPAASGAPRSLPGRSPAPARLVRPPRLTATDALWIGLLACVELLVSAVLPHSGRGWLAGAALSAGTVAGLYLYGWRARDRSAGVVAGLLAATSLPLLRHAGSAPLDALFALLSIGSLFSYLAGSSLLALVLAGFAAAARVDGVLIGVTLGVLALAQGRRRAIYGAAAFAAIAVAGWVIRHAGHPESAFPVFVGARSWLPAWAVASGTVFVSWLLAPWCAELGDPTRRARWLPMLLWTVVYGVCESFVHVTGRSGTIFAFTPLWFSLAGGGLSRLLPALTGDIPMPWARYALAAVAVLSIIGIRERADLPLVFSGGAEHASPGPRTATHAAPMPAQPATHVSGTAPAAGRPAPVPANPAAAHPAASTSAPAKARPSAPGVKAPAPATARPAQRSPSSAGQAANAPAVRHASTPHGSTHAMSVHPARYHWHHYGYGYRTPHYYHWGGYYGRHWYR